MHARAVFVTKVDPNYAQPWQMCPQRSSTGSAFVIDNEKRMILTNSHVVCAGWAGGMSGQNPHNPFLWWVCKADAAGGTWHKFACNTWRMRLGACGGKILKNCMWYVGG